MSTEGRYPPGSTGVPVVGDTVNLSRDIFGFYEQLQEEYGRIASYQVFGTNACMVADPDAIERILLDDHESYEKGDILTQTLGDAMGEDLFLTDGAQWQRQRTAMQPAFYRERLNTYVPVMRATAESTINEWVDGNVVELHEAMTQTTIDVLGRTLFGVNVANKPVVAEASAAILARTNTNRFWSFLPTSVPTPTNIQYKRELDRLRGFVDDLATQRREQSPEARGDDLLSILIRFTETSEFDWEELRDNIITFLFAGHETIALGLTYTLLCLARDHDEQARVRDEIETICDGPVTAEDLPDLERTQQAVDESLRLYPPVYLFFREPVRGVELGDYEVPAGTTLVLPQWVVHRDPEWWDAPESFRPERFARDAERPEYAYFPFGGGPRHCIGMRFARMEIRVVLATILSQYELELVSNPNPDLVASSNLKPGEPIKVRVHERA